MPLSITVRTGMLFIALLCTTMLAFIWPNSMLPAASCWTSCSEAPIGTTLTS